MSGARDGDRGRRPRSGRGRERIAGARAERRPRAGPRPGQPADDQQLGARRWATPTRSTPTPRPPRGRCTAASSRRRRCPGLDDARPAPGRRRGPGDPLGLMIGRARRRRVHLGRRHQLRADLPPLPAARRAGHACAPAWRTWSARSGPALGEGWFVTTRSTWYVGDEAVATMLFRVLKFRPAAQRGAAGRVGRAAAGRSATDTAFFWEGTAAGELRIQRCGVRRAAPPAGADVPGVRRRQAATTCVAAGRGTVYSYVVHHHPPVPGKRAAVRGRAGRTRGGRADGRRAGRRRPGRRSRIGMPVEVDVRRGRRRADAARLAAGPAHDRTRGRRRPAATSCPSCVIESTPDVRRSPPRSRPATSRTCTTTATWRVERGGRRTSS